MIRAAIAIAAAGLVLAVWRAGAPAPSPAPSPVRVKAAGTAASAPAPSQQAAAPAPAAPSPQQLMANVARTEVFVREARRHGKGEQEVHRLRTAALPAAQVEAIARMEAAEQSWRQRLDALQAACAANIGCDDARASFTSEELARSTAYAAPTLRQ